MDLSAFTTGFAQAQDQPEASYQALCDLATQRVGLRLFTLTIINDSQKEACRIYTNMPDAYPTLGTKPVQENPWSNKVLHRHETFVANTIGAISQVFFDHELIHSLGCASVINIPIVVAGKVLGTINCLHKAEHYTAQRVALSEGLKLPGAATFLLAHSDKTQGDL